MKLFVALLALGGTAASEGQASANNHTKISFDDIPTVNGLANVPSTYHQLSFSTYSVFTPRAPALEGLISERDLNCAVSSPNALLGSRPCEECKGPYFQIANTTAMKAAGLLPYFTLHSFYLKPLEAPEPGTTIRVKGLSEKSKEPLEWSVDFPSGYHLPLLVKIGEYSGEEWEKVYRIEIVADFGYDALDWEFCIDDIEVEFFALPESTERNKSGDQIVLQD